MPNNNWVTQVSWDPSPISSSPLNPPNLPPSVTYWAQLDGTQREVKMSTEKEEFYNEKLSKLVRFASKSEGVIGLEIECEGTKLFKNPLSFWVCHQDGSLREVGGEPPVEYVLQKPLSRPEAGTALSYLAAKLKAAGSNIAKSNRTSVHVHINCQDLTLKKIYNFITLYTIFEEILVEFSGPERIGNLFTLRAKDAEFFIEMLENALKQKNLNRNFIEDYRYMACNVHSLVKFGSLEFRSLRGTVDPILIETWIDMLLLVFNKSQQYDNPMDIVKDFSATGPLPYFRKIWDNEKLRRELEEQRNLAAKLWSGLRLIRDVVYSCEWKEALPVKKREQSEKENLKPNPTYVGNNGEQFAGRTVNRWKNLSENNSQSFNFTNDPTKSYPTIGNTHSFTFAPGDTMYYIQTSSGYFYLLEQFNSEGNLIYRSELI